jgi:hypothetical protein
MDPQQSTLGVPLGEDTALKEPQARFPFGKCHTLCCSFLTDLGGRSTFWRPFAAGHL